MANRIKLLCKSRGYCDCCYKFDDDFWTESNEITPGKYYIAIESIGSYLVNNDLGNRCIYKKSLFCTIDEPKNNELNYFQCVYWLEKNEEDFSKDGLWDYLLKNGIIEGNDTYCKLPSNSKDTNMSILMRHFDTLNTKYFVSW